MEDDPNWTQLPDQPHGTPAKRRTARSSIPGSALCYWVLGPVIPLLIGIIVAINLVPAVNTALGHGTRGSFTAVQYRSTRGSGAWTGTFKPADNGPAVTDVTFNGLSGVQPGSVVPALYDGGQAYTVNGSTQWLVDLVILLIMVGVLVAWSRRVPLRHWRQHGSVQPPPWARTT
jgi:hypothetical protein